MRPQRSFWPYGLRAKMPGRLRRDVRLRDALAMQDLRAGRTVRLRSGARGKLLGILPGAVMLVKGEPPEPGDVALLWSDGRWLAERVLERERTRVLLGAKARHGRWVSQKLVYGRVLAVRRDVRSWLFGLARLFVRSGQK